MKKKLLAVAALTAAYVLPAEAAMFKVDENTFANFGVRMQIRGQYLGEKTNADKSDIRFSVPNAQIYFAGQVNKFVTFGVSFETAVTPGAAAGNSIRPFDAWMGIRLGDIFGAKDTMNLQAGLQRIPVSRLYLTSSYSFIVPTGPTYELNAHGTPLVFRPIQQASDVGYGGFRHGGVTLWGNLADGMIKYYLGMFDVIDEQDAPPGSSQKSMYTVRLQFTPTMLGFKPEKAYALADTYLGRQNVLTIGVGYGSQKYTGTVGGNPAKTASEFAVDLLYEQKFGNLVPNFQAAYKTMENFGGNRNNDGKAYYVQGQLLYDQVVGIGKPALAIRYAKNDPDNTWLVAGTRHQKSSVIGAFVNYYIKGNDAKVALGFDSVKVDNKPTNAKNYTDVTLHLQVQF